MNKIVKRVFIGIAGILLTVLLTFLTFVSLIDSDQKIVVYLALIASVSLVIGWCGFIFGGKAMLLEFLPFGFFIVAFIIGSIEVPSEYKSVYVLAVFIAVIVYSIYVKTEKGKKKNLQKVENASAEIKEILKTADDKSDRKSILLLSRWSGYYQIIKGKNKYYLNIIGSEASGIKQELVVQDFSDEKGFAGMNKKDLTIAKEEIFMLRYHPKTEMENKHLNKGGISLFLEKGEKRFLLVDELNEEEVKAFFQGVPDFFQKEQEASESNHQRKMHFLIRLNNTLAIIAVLAAAVFYLKIQYSILAITCIVLSLSSFILYLKYSEILSISDNGKKQSGKVNVFITMFLPSVALLVRSFIDINIIDLKTLIIWAAILFVVMTAAFLLFTQEYKHSKAVIVMILLFILAFSPSAVAQVNTVFDSALPKNVKSQVINKPFDGNENAPRTFYLTVVTSDGETLKIKVTAEVYNDKKIDDYVNVLEYEGFLHISYAKILH